MGRGILRSYNLITYVPIVMYIMWKYAYNTHERLNYHFDQFEFKYFKTRIGITEKTILGIRDVAPV